ncbi:MAG TPA: ADOP family duplicated permease [Vicinamibacterales bacterium]|nr:ADOP family duplicated permease [Vicinamibacterales bacterium]
MNRRPPWLAQWLMTRSLHATERDVVVGDLVEAFCARASARGVRAARRWYWRQALSSVIPNVRRRLEHPRVNDRHQEGTAMDALIQDVRYSWRMLVRRPAMSLMALASLGVGISLCTVVFSLFNAVVIRPLAIADPDGLGLVLEVRTASINHTLPYPDFADYRAAQESFTDLAAYGVREVNVRQGDAARMVRAEVVSGSYFDVVGVRVRAGRPLTDADDRPGAPPVAVVSEPFWRDLHGGEAHDFGPQTIEINTQRFEIVGVVAAPFRGMQLGQDVRVWFTLHAESAIDPGAERVLASRDTSWLSVVGRLAPGVTHERAAADLNRLEAALAPAVGRSQPRQYIVANGRQGDSSLPVSAASPLRLLLLAAILVVLVASANVANLLISRGTERAREMAVRAALGAGSLRLARLVLLEALGLGTGAAMVGLVVAPLVAGRLVPFMADFGEPVTLDVALDWRVVLFASGVAILTALVAGVVPALSMQGRYTAHSLVEAARGASATRATSRARQGLVVLQFSVSLALIVVAALLTRTVHNLQTQPTGLDIDHVALLGVEPEAAPYDAAQTMAYVARAVDRLAGVPGVRAAAFARIPPLGFGGSRMTVIVPGYTPRDGEDMELNFNRVTPGYADALGLDLVRGRWIGDRDTASSRPVVVVNETMAHRYWTAGDAVGRSIHLGTDAPVAEVIGVVRDVKYRMLREDSRPSFYVPMAQMPAAGGVFHVRTAGAPQPMLLELRQALQLADPAVPVTTVRTLREQSTINVSDERLAMLIATILGGTALLLAAIGLYASVSYMVGQRVREIGVRVALGATGAEIRRSVLARGVVLALAGTLVGSGLAIALARLLENRLYGVTAADLPTMGLAVLMLTAIALLASDIPARRAARIDPVEALREE